MKNIKAIKCYYRNYLLYLLRWILPNKCEIVVWRRGIHGRFLASPGMCYEFKGGVKQLTVDKLIHRLIFKTKARRG